MPYLPHVTDCDGREITTPVALCQPKNVTDVSPLSFADRFQQVFPGLSVAEIARKLRIPHATARNYSLGRLPATEILIVIARETGVSLNWLLTGDGPERLNGKIELSAGEVPVYFGPKEHEIIQKLAGASKRSFEDEVRELLLEHLEEKGLVTTQTGESNLIFFGDAVPKMVELPFYGEIAAGEPLKIFPVQGKIDVPDFSRKANKQYMVLRVRGDSMIDDGILDGSLIICEATNTAEAGQTVVAVVDDDAATVKKYYPERSRIRLQPSNPAHLPQYVTDDRLKIQGIVIVIFHRPSGT